SSSSAAAPSVQSMTALRQTFTDSGSSGSSSSSSSTSTSTAPSLESMLRLAGLADDTGFQRDSTFAFPASLSGSDLHRFLLGAARHPQSQASQPPLPLPPVASSAGSASSAAHTAVAAPSVQS